MPDAMPDIAGGTQSYDVDLQACRGELSGLLRLAQALGTGGDGASGLQGALEHAIGLLGFDGGLIWKSDSRTPTLHLAGAVSRPPSLLAAMPAELEAAVGTAGQGLAVREPLLTSIEDWRGSEALRNALRAAGVTTVLEMPLPARGHAMGAMLLVTSRPLARVTFNKDLPVTIGAVVGMALLQAREHALLIQEERMAALGRMAAGVAHELNNPLTMLLGRTQLLRIKAATRPALAADEIARHAAVLEEVGHRMKRIVESLSLYSKPPKAELQPLEAAPLLTATLEMVEFTARKAGVTLRMDASGSRGLRLLGDRSYVLQVLLNLASNALDAVTRGGTVTLSALRGSDSDVALEVADDGPGIPREVQARIWEPFFTSKAEGTGLGLAIVRSLVTEMGGRIEVESEPNRGTVFRVSLPQAPLSCAGAARVGDAGAPAGRGASVPRAGPGAP